MKVAIIGAGISGLAIAKLLQEKGVSTTLFEKADKPGGLVRCQNVEGHLFHQTGGHVFNTKYQEVAEWFWAHFNQEEEFTKASRNSVAVLENKTIAYPIENHIYQLSDETQKCIIRDLLAMAQVGEKTSTNFEEFLRNQFGETLFQIYFQPYNKKIWQSDLKNIPLEWLEGKLPMPKIEEIIFNNFNHVKEKQFVHSTFYYPQKGGSQLIADRLAHGLDIRLSTEVEQISKVGDLWHINNEIFDKVVFCGNIKKLPGMLKEDIIKHFEASINQLEAHGTTAVLCSIDKNDYSWVYLPDQNYDSHRIICTGNFSQHNNGGDVLTASIEFTDYVTKEHILTHLSRMPFSPTYITHHFEPFTYPIQSQSTRELIAQLKQALEPEGIFLLGRFAEWEYYNMDIAIHAGMKLSDKILTL